MLAYTTTEGITATVTFDRWDCPDTGWDSARAQWRWTISAGTETLATGTDLRTGTDGRAVEAEALASLANFLGAWDESWTHHGADGENAGLFPAALRELSADWETVALDIAYALDTTGADTHP